MACKELLIINVILVCSAQAIINNAWNGYQHFTVPLPPIPFYGPIKIPVIRFPPIPTVQQIKNSIKNTIPKPGQLYNGVYVQSGSGFKKGKDGKLVRTGGTYAVTNNNGRVNEYKQFRG